jgi:DNA-binding LacI/PurR family transcriptional regulator
MNVNIYDVAKKSGLSVVTVSRVINNASSVRQYNRDKVHSAMKELGYVPNFAARSLAKGKTGIIGLVLPVLNDKFFNEVVEEINTRLADYNYLLSMSLEERNGSEKVSNFLFHQRRVDGIILLSPLFEDEYINELKTRKIPYVLIDNQKTQPSASAVLVDNYKGGYMAAQHLLNLGHKKIAFISGTPSYLSNRERKRGYEDALNNAGLKPFAIAGEHFDIAEGYKVTTSWLDADLMPTAIFAADDYIMLGAYDAIRERGLMVPEDISLIGYDDDTFSSEVYPYFTSVRQPAEALGRNAVEILLQLIEKNLKGHTQVTLEPELIIRKSTTPPKTIL